MHSSLQLVLILLAVAVLVAAAARVLRLPTMLGYLVTGIAIGPFALGWIPDSAEARYLAEFGVVFLMFSIGLEFSLPRLMTMRTTVFGFGGAQVLLTILLTSLVAWLLDLPLLATLALGGIMSMSSTAIVSKLLSERLEIQTPHGRQIFGALLFQDLAVVPLLILIPAFSRESDSMAVDLALAMFKAVVVLGFLLFVGQRIMRPWFQWVAGRKSPELFTLNLLLFTLGLAFLTESAGLSLALGAFLAGMLISETEYRYQVEDDIKPFRDVLLGLFFVTIGMRLDLTQVAANWNEVLLLLAAIVLGKGLLVTGLAMAFGSARPTAVRTALGLAQAGEFGFVLSAFALKQRIIPEALAQTLLLVIAFSMLLTPLFFILHDVLARRMKDEGEIVADDTIDDQQPVIIAGVGRFGQVVNRMVTMSGFKTTVLDHDLKVIELLRQFGFKGYVGDPTRPELLKAAGLETARVLVICLDDKAAATRLAAYARRLNPDLHIVARARDREHVFELNRAGANDIVREYFDSSLRAGRYVLENVGLSEYEASELYKIFFKLDRAAIRDLAEVWIPGVPAERNPAYIERAKALNRDLEAALQQRFSQTRDETVPDAAAE